MSQEPMSVLQVGRGSFVKELESAFEQAQKIGFEREVDVLMGWLLRLKPIPV